MTERPLNIGLTAWTDAAYQEYVEATTGGVPTDFAAWTDLELVAAESLSATVAAFVGTVTAEPGKLTIAIDEATLQALLPANSAAQHKQFHYVVRGRPTGTYRVRLMYGAFRLNKGLPEAAP